MNIILCHSKFVNDEGSISDFVAIAGGGHLQTATDGLVGKVGRGGPDAKFNDYFTKRLSTNRRKAGVTGDRKVFHSFRKNAAQALKDARCTPAEIAELIGHEVGFTLSVYAPQALPVAALKELIEKITYAGLVMPP